MGRHSAPDDGDDTPIDVAHRDVPGDGGSGAVAVRERDDVALAGRHAARSAEVSHEQDVAPDAIAAHDSGAGADVLDSVPARRGALSQVSVKQVSVRDAAHNSAADLHLVRTNRGVLAWCAVAMLVPFAVDVVILLVLGELTAHRFLVWVWAPLVAAGILLGVVLDAGHRRHGVTVPDDRATVDRSG